MDEKRVDKELMSLASDLGYFRARLDSIAGRLNQTDAKLTNYFFDMLVLQLTQLAARGTDTDVH